MKLILLKSREDLYSTQYRMYWASPSRGTLKMNVDAHLSSDGHWFSGLILRRSGALLELRLDLTRV
jgi:hypothetical protein